MTIEPVLPEPQRLEPVFVEPNSSVPFSPKPADREPANLPPPDPVPVIEPPLAVYPEAFPPIIYAPGCHAPMMLTCSTGMYDVSPMCEDACAAESICGCCVRSWTLRAEMILWDRAGGANVPLIAAPVALNSGDLDGSWRAGPRLTAIKHGVFDSCWDLEVAYFGIDSWSGTRAIAGVTGYLTTPPLAFAAAPVAVTYSSSLHSGEVNGRRVYNDWVTWFVGFRTLQIDELLSANINAGASSHSVATQNRLYGGQLGLDALLHDGVCWNINAVGKVGVYGNSTDQVTRTAGLAGPLPFITYTGNQTSFVGELGLNATYQLTERLTFLVGYNLLWVNGVALAPDQLAATNVNTGVGALDTNGNLFYHGVNIGLEYGW